MTGLFDKIKKDVQRGIGEGIAMAREGAAVVSEKVGELTAEGKRQYKIFALKAKIQGQMTELGGRAYDCLDSKKSPAADGKVKAVYSKIKKLEAQLSKLEGIPATKAATPKKQAAKAKTKPPQKKTAATPKRAAAKKAPKEK
ncbi:MAG: hypothetical protein M0009_08960 [Deltaproteobacteria bacterium]|nr:hypothetical protein [Deltaproteobacteria bacterium]